MHIVKNCTQLQRKLNYQTSKNLQGSEPYGKSRFLTMYQMHTEDFVRIRLFTMHLSMDCQRTHTVLSP